MGLKLFYSKIDFLKLVHTGNSLGLRGSAGGSFSIDVFSSLDPSLNAGKGISSSTDPLTYAGTTNNPSQNGSWALLNPSITDVPLDSTVDTALLVWGFQNSSSPNTPITFSDPSGNSHTLTPDPAYSVGPVGSSFYTRAVDVTTIVRTNGLGEYAVSGVPNAPMGSGNGVGWSLIVAFRHPSMPLRNVSIFVGDVSNGETTSISGFYTPSSGPVFARAFVMALYGDSDYGGDTFQVNGIPLSGPRNPMNNFFCSQVCDYTGNLATIGSFANNNCEPGISPKLERAEFDLTNVDATGALDNAVMSANVGIGGGGDVLTANALALEINANSAIITNTKYVDKTVASLGDTLNYKLVVKNTGSSAATNVRIFDTLPSNTTLVPNSIFLNGTSITGNLETGINIGTIPNINGVSTITFSVLIDTGLPTPFTIPNSFYSSFDFLSDPNKPPLTNSTFSNTVETFIFKDTTTIVKSVNLARVTSNSTITYTLKFANPNSVPLNNIVIYDTIPNTTSFVADSVIVNNVPRLGVNPQTGIPLPNLLPNETHTITFDVLSSTGDSIPNFATASYLYNDTIPRNIHSNTVFTDYVEIKVSLIKNTDKPFATLGNEIEYTLTIKNTSNIDLINLILKDTIPNNTTFINNSATLNGTPIPQNPETGIPISILPQLETATITFKVLVSL